MEPIIAYCGLTCSSCPAYEATQSGDQTKVREIAEKWSKEWGIEMKPEDVMCDGCLVTEGRHVGYWATCEIRRCTFDKGLVNCGHCDDYICDRLEKWFGNAPQARETLDQVRESL